MEWNESTLAEGYQEKHLKIQDKYKSPFWAWMSGYSWQVCGQNEIVETCVPDQIYKSS